MAERTGLTYYEENIAEENVDETKQIRERIEETRQEMGETIQAIEERLSLDNISEQVSEQISEKASEIYETAKDNVYQATIGKAGKFMKNVNKEIKKSGILEKAVENPLPLFFIAFGAGLLVFKGKNGRRANYDGNRRRNLSAASQSDSSLIKNTREKIDNAASSVYDTVGGVAGNAAEQIEHIGTRARDGYDYYINENPLAVGAVALALGVVVGLAIPATSYENELMGEARENLLSKAQDTAKETVEKVKKVAGEAVSVVSEDVVEKAKQVAGNAAETISTEAENQRLT